jgi:hypothetical protein
MVSTFEREIEFTKTSHGATRIVVQDYGQCDLLLTLSATTIPLSSIFQAEMEKEKFLDDGTQCARTHPTSSLPSPW